MTDDIDCLGDNRALQTALELSMLNLSNATYSTSASQDPSFSSYYSDSSLLSGSPKKSQNITQCVAVPSSEHVAEIVGRQGMFLLCFFAKLVTTSSVVITCLCSNVLFMNASLSFNPRLQNQGTQSKDEHLHQDASSRRRPGFCKNWPPRGRLCSEAGDFGGS